MKQVVYRERDVRRMFEFVIGIKRKGLDASERKKWPTLANLKLWAEESVRAHTRHGRDYSAMVTLHRIADAISDGRPIAKIYRDHFASRKAEWRVVFENQYHVFAGIEFAYGDFLEKVMTAAKLQDVETIEFLKKELPHLLENDPPIVETVQ